LRFGGFCNLVPSVLREKEPPQRREMARVAHAGTAVRRTGQVGGEKVDSGQ